jgi:hypothetical protein
MPLELHEVDALIDADRDPVSKETIETAIQAMLFHQVIYEDTPGISRDAIAALRRHRVFFERYFSAAGFRLRIETREQMIALEIQDGVYGWRQTRLKKDETLVRLALRFLLDKGLETGAMDEAMRIPATTDDIVDIFRTLAPQVEVPAEARLTEILRTLHRVGAVRVGDRDRAERMTEVLLLPGLRIHVPDVFIERVILWTEQGCAGDVFEFMAERRREDAANAAEGVPASAANQDGFDEAED